MSATLLLTAPNANRALSLTITAACQVSFTRKVSTAIREFASKRGLSPLSVDYEIIRGRR